MSLHALPAPRQGDTKALKELAGEMRDYVPMRMGQAIFAKNVRMRAFDSYRAVKVAVALKTEALTTAMSVERVKDALKDRRWDFRTVSGLVDTTGLSEETVRAALATGVARRPWRRPGSDLFTSIHRPVINPRSDCLCSTRSSPSGPDRRVARAGRFLTDALLWGACRRRRRRVLRGLRSKTARPAHWPHPTCDWCPTGWWPRSWLSSAAGSHTQTRNPAMSISPILSINVEFVLLPFRQLKRTTPKVDPGTVN